MLKKHKNTHLFPVDFRGGEGGGGGQRITKCVCVFVGIVIVLVFFWFSVDLEQHSLQPC